jgi:hypothetical protein
VIAVEKVAGAAVRLSKAHGEHHNCNVDLQRLTYTARFGLCGIEACPVACATQSADVTAARRFVTISADRSTCMEIDGDAGAKRESS